jgi:cysteine dioxygenase
VKFQTVETEAFELILICWGAGQSTPIHDHGGEECWVNVLAGEIHEKMYVQDANGKLNCTKTSKRLKGEISYMVDFMGYHRLENNTTSRACTLHLYAKPIRNCNIFDAQAQEFVDTEMKYHTVANLQTT